VNPKYIAEYTFPGIITGYCTHPEYVKLARQGAAHDGELEG
jgi:hypothetical protein